jgi:hypothetical protein
MKKFYLDFKSKKDAAPAFMNMLMLNYNNFLDVDDEKKIQPLTKEKANSITKSAPYSDLIQSDY